MLEYLQSLSQDNLECIFDTPTPKGVGFLFRHSLPPCHADNHWRIVRAYIYSTSVLSLGMPYRESV